MALCCVPLGVHAEAGEAPGDKGGFYGTMMLGGDVSGTNTPALARDGQTCETTLTFPVYMGERSMMMAGLGYARGDFDGNSNSFDGYCVSLMHALDMGRWGLSTFLSGGQKTYDATHPVFGKTREEMDWQVSTEYTYHAPFGPEGFFLQLRGAMGETIGNISFFESSTLMVGAGVGYNY